MQEASSPGGWASSLRWLRGRESPPGQPCPKRVAEMLAVDCVVSVLRAPFSPITDLMEPPGQGVG